MGILNKFKQYITFAKDKENADNKNIKMMHGMNKISLTMFIVAMVLLIVKCVR